MTEASHRLHSQIKCAFKCGTLERYLSSIGMANLYPRKNYTLYDTNPNGKILIIGDSRISEREIYGIMKEFGISKERVELLSYDEAKRYSFRTIQYNANYRLILFGPIPHSGKGKQDKASIISQVENNDGYPKVVRLYDSHGLKITKSSLKNAINQEILCGYLVV